MKNKKPISKKKPIPIPDLRRVERQLISVVDQWCYWRKRIEELETKLAGMEMVASSIIALRERAMGDLNQAATIIALADLFRERLREAKQDEEQR